MTEIDCAAPAGVETSTRTGFTGLLSLAAATTMLFAALASAYVVRRGLAADWTSVHLPLVIAGSVVLLVLGSAALQKAATDCIARRPFAPMWYAGLASGMLFVLVQAWAWSEIGQSASIASSPAAAFLYVLTGMFVLFLCGTMAAGIAAGHSHARMKTVAYYWHYLDVLWIGIVMLLFLER